MVIPPDDCYAHAQTSNTKSSRLVSKKRKRRRRNEYDFGPKRKRAKKKVASSVMDENVTEDSDLFNTNCKPPDLTENATVDSDSLNAVKDLYGHSDAKRYQDDLFGDEKPYKPCDSVNSKSTPVTTNQLVRNNSSSLVSSQGLKQSSVGGPCNPCADRCLTQTTCCQFYKSRRKPNPNEARTYRRRHGLWMKGKVIFSVASEHVVVF